MLIAISILLAALAGIVSSVIILWTKVIRPGFRVVTRLSQVIDVICDLPEWCEEVDESLKELKPNGGGSMKDRIRHIYETLEDHIADTDAHSVNDSKKDAK